MQATRTAYEYPHASPQMQHVYTSPPMTNTVRVAETRPILVYNQDGAYERFIQSSIAGYEQVAVRSPTEPGTCQILQQRSSTPFVPTADPLLTTRGREDTPHPNFGDSVSSHNNSMNSSVGKLDPQARSDWQDNSMACYQPSIESRCAIAQRTSLTIEQVNFITEENAKMHYQVERLGAEVFRQNRVIADMQRCMEQYNVEITRRIELHRMEAETAIDEKLRTVSGSLSNSNSNLDAAAATATARRSLQLAESYKTDLEPRIQQLAKLCERDVAELGRAVQEEHDSRIRETREMRSQFSQIMEQEREERHQQGLVIRTDLMKAIKQEHDERVTECSEQRQILSKMMGTWHESMEVATNSWAKH